MAANGIIIIMIRNTFILTLLLSPLLLGGCTGLGLMTGAAAVTGISAAQEGGIPRAIDDAKIKLKINEAWFQYDVDAFRKLSTTVNQGRVLITGVVQDPAQRVEAVRLVWLVEGVTQVINEIRVADSAGVTGFVKDAWITSRLRGSLTLDRGVQSINYSIDTVQGVVYLMGVAQNQAELNRVIETARTISGVKQVVSYVKLAGEPLSGETKAKPLPETNVPAQPQNFQTNSHVEPLPQQSYSPVMSTSNVNTTPEVEVAPNVDVPTKSVSENAPSIADQYYN